MLIVRVDGTWVPTNEFIVMSFLFAYIFTSYDIKSYPTVVSYSFTGGGSKIIIRIVCLFLGGMEHNKFPKKNSSVNVMRWHPTLGDVLLCLEKLWSSLHVQNNYY